MNRQATMNDFIKPEFIGENPEDYEVLNDGSVVRKDRWERGIRRIACHCGCARQFDVDEVVEIIINDSERLRELYKYVMQDGEGIQFVEAFLSCYFDADKPPHPPGEE